MTYKQIESSRNVRLWITSVILPAATLAITTLIAMPEVRHAAGQNLKKIGRSIKRSFKKGKTSNTRIVLKLDAENRDEALGALEALAKELFESTRNTGRIKKSVHVKQ